MSLRETLVLPVFMRFKAAADRQWRMEEKMKPSYEEMVKFMKEYFKAYNDYAQNKETVGKMSDYFTPDVHFIPYISSFGGPENAVKSRDDFFHMFTGHPSVYEKFEEIKDIVVDERRMVATALLHVALYETKTDRLLLRKHYLPRYQLVLDDNKRLKISQILFFWESVPPEVDALYAIDSLE